MSVETIGKYRVIGKLGQGGMARVLLTVVAGAHGVTKLLVLKELREDLTNDVDFVQMFLNEARLAARLNHPNVVQTYEVGQEGERYFIAMEYLEGQPLHAILRRVGRPSVPLDIHLRVLVDMLRGLDYAHSLADFNGTPLNVVHRDISPQNVFVTYDGQVKLVDFGIAKVAGANSNTQEGMFKGKLSYVAPEQVRCDKIDARADLFAVGVMLWEAIAGRRLVSKDEDERSIISRRVNGNDPKIKDVIPECPDELAAICDRSLSLLPEARFQTAKEFAESLEDYLESSGYRVGAREVGALVSGAFQPDRQKVRSLVDEQIKGLTENMPKSAFALTGSYAKVTGTFDNVSSSVSRISKLPILPPPGSSAISSSTDMVAATPVSPHSFGPPQRSIAPLILGGAIVVAGAITGFALLRRGHGEPSTAAAAQTTAVETAAPPPAAPPPSAKTDATIAVVIHYPTGATAKLDGGVVDGNPFRAKVAKDGTLHQLEVSSDGYATEKKELTFDQDLDVTVTLAKSKDKSKPHGIAVAAAAPPPPQPQKPEPVAQQPTLPPPPQPGDDLTTRPKPRPGIDIDDTNPYAKKP
jgi:serine/threonine protein kinase